MPDNLYRRGAVWWGRIKVDGKDNRRSLRTTSKTVAKERLKTFREEMEHLAYYGENRHTWKEAVVQYIQTILPGAVKPNTAKRYLVSLKQVGPHLESLFVDEVNFKTIGKLVTTRKRDGATNATIRRDLTAVSRVLAATVSWGWREDNPAKTWDRDVIPERRDPIARVSDEAIARYLAKCPAGFGRVVRFLLLTGMRQNEAVTLRRGQLRKDTREIHLAKTKSRPRVITVSQAAWDVINEAPLNLAHDYVFTSDRVVSRDKEGRPEAAGPFANFASRFAQIRARAKTTFRCHDLRHEFAIRELESGRDIYDLSRHLGHSSVKVTEMYLDYIGESGARARAQRKRSDAPDTEAGNAASA